MNSLFSKSAFALINLAALAVCCTGVSAQAETGNLPLSDTTATVPAQNVDQVSELAVSAVSTEAIAPVETTASNKENDSISSLELNAGVKSESEPAIEPALEATAAPETPAAVKSEAAQFSNQENTSIATDIPSFEATAPIADNSVKVQPIAELAQKVDRPSSIANTENSALIATQEQKEVKTAAEVLKTPVSNSASALTNQPPVAEKSETASETPDKKVAQVDVRPGRATRSGPSYIGIGGNLGFGGDSALGDSSFAIISKIGLTSNISVRPTVLFRDDLTFLVPLTYDFVSQNAVEVSDDFVITAAPYAGAGVTISTGDNSNFGFLISGGVDVPLSRNFTATAGVNIGFLDGAEAGLLIGVGYTFPNVAR